MLFATFASPLGLRLRPLASYRALGFDGAGTAVVRMLGAAGL
jgi:hypothetical protein